MGHAFEKTQSVKKLDSLGSLALEDQDLIALGEELRPYVESKSWKDVREMLFNADELHRGFGYVDNK